MEIDFKKILAELEAIWAILEPFFADLYAWVKAN